MTNKRIFPKTSLAILLGVATVTSSLIGCSSSDSNSNTSSTRGAITGFGSVYVNGVEYETDSASITDEDVSSTEDALQIGMMVTIEGTVNSDGLTGTATSIAYDDNVEGIVLVNNMAVDSTLDVMGQTVTVNGDTTFESNVVGVTTPETIAAGNVVEISGYSSGNGAIFATRIEVKTATYAAGDEIELKGYVSNSTATTFTIGTLIIDHSNAQLDDVTAPIANGTFVEAQSIEAIDIPNMTMMASKVEAEDDGIDDAEGSEVEIEGVVTAVTSDTEFVLNDRIVTHSSNTEFEDGTVVDIIVGARLEAEGSIDAAGNLVAEEIEFRSGTELELSGNIESIDMLNSTVTMFGKVFQINNMTSMQDESASDVRFFSISNLAVADRVEIHAHMDAGTSVLIATSLERNDETSDLEIEGKVDADVTAGANSLTISGITVNTTAVAGSILNMNAGDSAGFSGSFISGEFVATSLN